VAEQLSAEQPMRPSVPLPEQPALQWGGFVARPGRRWPCGAAHPQV